jgi:thiol-disulfide isomerase/thioredoxin
MNVDESRSDEAGPESETPSVKGRRARQRLALIGAVALTLIAAALLVYQLADLVDAGSAPPPIVKLDAADAAPVPLGPQAFSFLAQPAAVADLKFVDGDGKALSLSDFRGRPLLLNIWATWCLPCRKEMPSLDRLQAKFDPRKLLVLTLSIDRGGIPAVKKFYADLGLKSLGIYVDQSGGALHKLGLFGIPASLLIDPEGREIGRKLGPAEWDSADTMAALGQHLLVDAPQPAPGASP